MSHTDPLIEDLHKWRQSNQIPFELRSILSRTINRIENLIPSSYTEMMICEIDRLTLHADQTYVFRRDESCSKCMAYGREPVEVVSRNQIINTDSNFVNRVREAMKKVQTSVHGAIREFESESGMMVKKISYNDPQSMEAADGSETLLRSTLPSQSSFGDVRIEVRLP